MMAVIGEYYENIVYLSDICNLSLRPASLRDEDWQIARFTGATGHLVNDKPGSLASIPGKLLQTLLKVQLSHQ